MITDYYLLCEKCAQEIDFWRRTAGGCGPSASARDRREHVQNFLYEHLEHGIVVVNEHDERRDAAMDNFLNRPEH